MGRTLPSITNAFLHEQQSLARFRRALRRTDQRALDDLFGASRHHLAAAAYASHLLPFEIMLLSMLVEEHKLVLHLQVELERLHLLLGLEGAAPSETTTAGVPALPAVSLDLHEPSLPPYDPGTAIPSGMPFQDAETRRSAIPERKRKWWAGG